MIHVISGGIVGMIYTFLVKPYNIKSGVLFMLAFWLVMMLAVSPLTGQGFWGLKLGSGLPIATFMLHVVFGAVMGTLAQRMSQRNI